MATDADLPIVQLDDDDNLPIVKLDDDNDLPIVQLDDDTAPVAKPSAPLAERIASMAVANPAPWEQPTMGPGPAPMGIAERVGRAIRESASFVVGKTPEQALREAQDIRAMSADVQPISDAELERRYTKTVTNPDGTTYETLNPDRLKSPVTSSIARGVDNMQDAAYGLAQWAATIAGMDTPTLDEWRKANQKEISDNPPLSPGPGYALQRGSVGDMLTFATESAAEALPQGLPSMGAGAVAGRLATSAAAKATMQAGGAALPNIGQAIGGIFGDAVDSGTRDREAALVAAKYGIASGLLDTIGDVLFLNKAGAGMDTALKRKLTADILNTPSGAAMVKAGVKTMGAEGFKQALSEAGTEVVQTALEQSAQIATDDRGLENYWTSWAGKMWDRDREAARFQAGAAGFAGGAGMGMASTVPEVAGKFLQMSAGTRALNEINEILKEGKMGTPAEVVTTPSLSEESTADRRNSDPKRYDRALPAIDPKVQSEIDGLIGQIELGDTGISPGDPKAMLSKSVRLLPVLKEIVASAVAAGVPRESIRPVGYPLARISKWVNEYRSDLAARRTGLGLPLDKGLTEIEDFGDQSVESPVDLLRRANPILRNEPDAESGLREALSQESSNSPLDLLRRASRPNANNQAVRRAAIEDAMMAPPEPVYDKPRVATTPDTDSGLAEALPPRPTVSPIDEAIGANRKAVLFPPLDPNIQGVIDTLDTKITESNSGASALPTDEAFTRSMHAAAINALKVLDNRILSGIDAGIPDVTLDPILAQRERIAAWEENNRPPGTTGASVAAALAQARPAPQISVPGASGAAIAEAQSAVPVPLAPVAVQPAPTPAAPAAPPPVTTPPPSTPAVPTPAAASPVAEAIARQSGQTVPEGAPVKLTVSRSDREKNKRALIAEKKRAGEIKKELTDAELKRASGRELVAASVPLRKAVDDYVEAASGIIDFKAPTDAMAQEAMRDKLTDTLYTYIGNRGQDAFRQNEAGEPVFDGGKFALNKILQDGLVSYLKSKKAATSTGRAVSFDQEVGEDGGATVGDMVADPNAPDPTAEKTKKLAPIRAEIVQFVADKLLGGKVATADELELIASGVKLILNKEMYAQLGGVDVNKRSTSKGLLAWVDENKEDVLDALKEYLPWATKSKGIGPRELMSMIKEEFTDPGINLTGDGDGMFVEDVNDAIAGMLGSIPDYIRVANDPLLVNSAGEPIKGVFIGRPGGEASITINAANHTNSLDVAITLLHEAVHAVWDSPYVRVAAARLERSMSGELPGYSQAEIREELAVRAITDRWTSQQQRALWRKLVDAIYAAIRRTFGMKPTDQQLMDIIAAEAIRFLNGSVESNRVTMRLSTGRRRRGPDQQVFVNKKQVDDAKARPGLSPEQQHGIDVVAGAIAALVPRFFVTQMERAIARRIDPTWPAASRSLAKAQRSAARLLRGITDIGRLASVPVNVAGIAVEDKFVAAASVLEVKERISHRKATLQRMLDKATAKLTAAQTQAARITKLNAKVAAADALTRTLVDSMEESLAAQEKLAPSLSAKEKASVDALKKTLGLIKFNAPARVGPALQSIAAVMPPGADPVRFLRVQQATGWPAWGSPATAPMDGTVFDFLAGSMPITGASAAPLTGFGLWTPGALEGRTDAIERIRKLQVDQVHAQQVVDNVAALFKSLGAIGIKKPTLTSFTRLYSALRKKRSAAFEQASDLSSDIRKATESLDAVSAAMNMLDAIEAHGSHRAQVRRAAGLMDSARKRLGDADSEIIQDYKDGGWIVTDPITRKTRTMKVSTDPDVIRENGRNADELLRNIDAYLTAADTDPSTAETYRRMVPALRNVWLANANIASLTGRVQRVAFSKEWFVNLVPELAGFALRGPNLVKETVDRIVGNITGNVVGRDLIYQYLGQPIGQILNRYMARTDWMDNVIRSAMDNSVWGSGANKIALFRRVNQLAVSLDLPYGQAISVYAHDVLDHIYAMGGNMGGMQAYVGMRSPGGTVLTAEDFAIARMGKLYNDYLLTQMRKKSEGVLSEVSLQTEDEAYFRNAVDWGWKMKRRRSRWGHEFLSQWDEARLKDLEVGAPGFSDNRAALLDNADNFVNAVNKTVATTDPTWKSSDKVQAEAMLARLAMPDWTFQTMADFLDWMANERAAIINRAAGAVTTTYAEQRVLAEQVLLKDLDTAVKRLMDAETKDTDSESRVAGMGEATITALGGRSSFTEPRPPMAAPNGFYSYSIALDEDRLMLNAAAKRVYQVMELHALQNVITALQQEEEQLIRKQRDFMNSQPNVWRWSSRREFAKQEVRNVLAGKATTTLRALTRVMTHLRAAEKGMTQAIQQARVEEGAALRVARTSEAVMTVLKLLSPTVGFTNFLSSVFISPMISSFARNRSKYAILSGLMSIGRSTYHLSKNLMEWTTNLVAGNRPMKAWLNKHRTAWGGVADYLLNVIKRREDDIAYLAAIGIQQPPPFREQAGRWFYETFPLGKTGGTVTEREGSWSEGIFRWALSPFSFGTVLAGMFNAKTDFTGLRVQLGMHKAMLETLRADAITAFDVRKRMDPVNYASMPIRPFTPEEIGEKNLNGLNWLRDLFSPAGGLEAVLLDFYQRAEKAGSPLNIPLMNENVERDVMMHIMGKGNIVNDSGKGEGLKGRGWGGLARTFAGRFYQYGAMFSGTLGQALHNDIRMSTGQNFAHAVGVFSIIAALTVIAGVNLAGGQELTELVKGKVANAPSMAALMQDEGWVAAMKIFILGGANLYVPTAGDLISSTITGSQPKNILDLGSMIPGLGVATSGYKWAQSVLQTGDLYYPTIALLKQNHPLVEPIFNRVPGLGAQDLPLINAARSYRSAAPSSMEIRQPGGNYRMSPDTVLVRDALRAAALNDKEEFDGVIQRAMDQATEAGKDPLAARSKILSSVKSKTPERSVFGRELTDEERAEVMARMNSSQADSVAKAGEITARIGSWIKSAPGGLSKRKPKTYGRSRRGGTRYKRFLGARKKSPKKRGLPSVRV